MTHMISSAGRNKLASVLLSLLWFAIPGRAARAQDITALSLEEPTFHTDPLDAPRRAIPRAGYVKARWPF